MRKYLVACLFILGVAGPAFAAHQLTVAPPAKHFAVKDTVGNCSVVDIRPSRASDLRILGSTRGYASVKDAQAALGSGCKSKIDRG
jgi:hypothetical protein